MRFQGTQRYPTQEVERASGLRVGETVTVGTLEAAVQALGETGAFESVAYRYALGKSGLEVTFELTDAKGFVRCVYDNFVWYSDADIVRHLRQEVPLFDGSVPEGGGLVDRVTAALESLVRNRSADARVEYMRSGELGGKDWRVVFRVSRVNLPIKKLRFPGAAPVMSAQLAQTVRQLFGKNYSREDTAKFAVLALIPVYRQNGFLRASFAQPTAELVSADAPESGVSVILPVDEGIVYAWERAEWSGNHLFPAADLDFWLGMKNSELADGLKIDAGLNAVREHYGTQGHLEVKLREAPEFDDAKQRVIYRIQVAEGPRYRMGNFVIRGVSVEAEVRIRPLWGLRTGDIYNASYIKEFQKSGAGKVLGRAGGTAKGYDFLVKPDREKKIVHVELEIH